MVKRRITKDYYNHYYKQKYNLLKKISSNLSKKYNVNHFDDFMAIARNELLYSMIHFDSTLGAFNTILWHRISGSIRHCIDTNIKQVTRYESETRREFINAEYNEPVCSGLVINEMLDHLDDDESQILKLRYLSGMTLLEITEKTGFSTYKILDLQKCATEKLRNKFGSDLCHAR